MILQEEYYWHIYRDLWIYGGKKEYAYDDNGNLILRIGYGWDSGTETHIPATKLEKVYDIHGNKLLEVDYYWDSNNNDWIPNRKEEFSFDTSGNVILWANQNWDTAYNEWGKGWKAYYYYSDITSGYKEPITNEDIICYPNPSSGTVWIKIYQPIESKIMIYMINGKLVYSKKLYQNITELDLSSLQQGIYVFKIYNNDNIYVRKVILK